MKYLGCLVFLFAALPAFAQTGENVALVINEASPASQQIGEHYVRARAIPSDNVIRIRTSTDDTIDRSAYGTTIEQPIAATIVKHGLHDRILYIVLTKGVPLRIAGTDGLDGTLSSVDSELTLLYRRMSGRSTSTRGRVPNPYYLDTTPVREAKPFTHREHDIFLVSRLDAFTVDEAIALIDRARAPSSKGRVVLDQRAALLSEAAGDRWLAEAAKRLTAVGQDRVVLEETTRAARDLDQVLGYYSWGSTDESNRVRRFGLKFVPGALAATFVSTDGRTFQNPPDTWVPTGNSNDRKTWFGGSPQSLIGDLIREGATGVAGHVAEPYLQSTFRPEILFPTYFAGFNLIEAFYLALPHLSWQSVVVGDPLCVAFPRESLTRDDIEDNLDPGTELPGLFSKRRLDAAQLNSKGVPIEALAHAVLGETRLARADTAGAKKALEEATALAPALTGSQLALATIDEQAGDYASANQRYRAILKSQPDNVLALNNLAYGLAVRENQPAAAQAFAKRASALAPDNASILDTLGWIEHLLGNSEAAAQVLSRASKLGPAVAEIRLHAAIVFAANGALTNAEAELKEALRLNPEFEQREDVAQLRKKLKGG